MKWLQSIVSSLKIDRLANTIGDSLWQANCPLCKRPADGILCKDCDRQIMAYQSADFLQKDHPISSNIPLYSWGIYDGALKRAIASCKYDNHPEIMEAIAAKMADTWKRSTESQKLRQAFPKLSVVPIPLHSNKLKSRGFNQAEVLAKRFCELSNLSCNAMLLQRVKDTKAQMQTKSSKERIENLARAFTVSFQHNSNQRNIILFDDIYTTGATIREAIATLATHQFRTCAVIVLARPQFQLPKPQNS
ncbi:ComF family protein [Pseudanabaena sp. FACHB-1998]|uniref:ComF family protein n=1 Tax=Pseudanabaena sp. FACHB-1998 TaxID=2692858 RepID=UPI00168019E7|nr:ComF family protein [Pseudanabaena sp. FACHB-1998]MBD2179177.1 ComF family protein [Pseudanabaena sp. FACHB-1998]